MRITISGNDKSLADAASAALHAIGHHCSIAHDADTILEQLRQEECDLLIADWPIDGDGIGLLRTVRALSAKVPVLLVTARAPEEEIASALDGGASDYIIKPLRRGELAARVRVLLMRAYPEQRAEEVLQFGVYAFEPACGRITVAGKAIDTTQKEFNLALLFFRHLGRPLSRTYIREAIWPGDAELPSRTIDTHVSRVRRKLALQPENGFRLSPVYSFGYQLEQVSR